MDRWRSEAESLQRFYEEILEKSKTNSLSKLVSRLKSVISKWKVTPAVQVVLLLVRL